MVGGVIFSSFLVLAGLALALLLLVIWFWMLIDCLKNEPSEGNDKVVWLLVIILLTWIGALIYFFARRDERIRKFGH